MPTALEQTVLHLILALATMQASQPEPVRRITGPSPRALDALVAKQDTTPHKHLPIYQTYAREGALLVGIPLGVLTALVGDALCRDSDTGGFNHHDCFAFATVSGITVGGVGGLIGALVGSGFQRNPLRPDATIGDHSATIGLIFAAIGAVFGMVSGGGDCYQSCTGSRVKTGLLFGIMDGFIGYGLGSLFPKFARP